MKIRQAGFLLFMTVSQVFLSAAESNPFAFSGPEVSKIDWNTRSLIAKDMNNDGLNDLMLINNDRAKIEILYQQGNNDDEYVFPKPTRQNRWEPVVEDARFRRQSIVSGGTVYALAAGDLNGDGLPEIAYTGKQEALTIRYQNKEKTWKETFTFDDFEALPWTSTLKITDLNNDGRNDLIVLARDKLLLFLQNSEGEINEPKTFLHTEENAYAIDVVDINQDDLPDLLYRVGKSDYALRIRLQYPEIGFGPELGFSLKIGSGAVHPGKIMPSGDLGFIYIESQTRLIETFTLKPDAIAVNSLESLQPHIYATGTSGRDHAHYAFGDFNADGRLDLAVGDVQKLQILVFLQNESGIFKEPLKFPSLNGITSIVGGDFQGKGRASLLIVSARENMAGIAHFTEKEGLPFPELLKIEGEPQVAAAADFDRDERDEIVWVEKIKEKYQLTLLDWIEKDQIFNTVHYPLEGLERDPSSIEIIDLNGDARLDIIIPVPRDPAHLYIYNESGAFDPVAVDSAIRKSLLTNISAKQMGYGDTDGDGVEELIFTSKGFARSTRLNGDGKLEIIHQFNARGSQDIIQAPLLIDLDRDGQKDLLFYDFDNKTLQLLQRDGNGIFRYKRSAQTGPIHLISAHLLKFKHDQHPDIVFLGKDRFWVIPLSEKGWELKVTESYETDLKDVIYNDLALGDLNKDGSLEIIAIDGTNHILEILSRDQNKTWNSVLHFTVFEENFHYQGRRGSPLEPREVLVSDFNGDTKDDIVLLVHDRILFYYQE